MKVQTSTVVNRHFAHGNTESYSFFSSPTLTSHTQHRYNTYLSWCTGIPTSTLYILCTCVFTPKGIFLLFVQFVKENKIVHMKCTSLDTHPESHSWSEMMLKLQVFIYVYIYAQKKKKKNPPQYEDVEWKLVARKLSTHDIQASLALENYALLFCIRRTRHCSVFCKFSATKIILRLLHSTCLNKQRNYTGKVAGKKRLLILMLCSFSQCLTNSTSDQACTENQNLTTLLFILVTLIKMAK